RRERSSEPLVPIPNCGRAVDVRRRPYLEGDSLQRNALAMHHAVDARESARQYDLAHTASAVEGRPHLRHLVGASAERNSSSGRTRIVALVSSLMADSHASSPHHPAYTKPPLPAIN